MFVPVYKNGHGQHAQVSKERHDSYMTGEEAKLHNKIEYDTNFIDYNMLLRNLKTNTIELTERIYVDKPLKKQKEIPIEN